MNKTNIARYAGAALAATAVLGSTACTGSPASASAAAASCTGSAIQVEIKSAGAAMNHFGDVLIFTNHGGSACTLQGYPGIAVMKGSTTLLDAKRTLGGYMAGDPAPQSAPLVTLAPGKSASAMVEWVGDAGEACYTAGAGTLRVTPPNTRNTLSFGPLTLGGRGVCADFQVHPVTDGILPHLES